MRIAVSHRRPPPVEPNMTPMIDVVFLLIIFFLVSSHLARRESRLELPLPEAATATHDLTDATPRLVINVRGDGQALLGTNEVDPAALAEALREQRARHGDRLHVRLRGDRSVAYEQIEPLLAACAEAGIDDIGLAVFAKKGGEPQRN